MQEEFEKKVQERMLTFGMQPSPQVWDDIDAALGKRKHRRVFIGWWILLGLVIAGGGILFYQKDNILHNELNQQPVPVADSATHNNMAQTPAATPAQKPADTTAPVTLITPAAPTQGGTPTTNTSTQAYSQHNTSSSKGALSSRVVITPSADNALTADNNPVNNSTNNTTAVTGNNNPAVNSITPNSGIAQTDRSATTPNAGTAEPPLTPQAATKARDTPTMLMPVISPFEDDIPANVVPTPDKKQVAITPKTIASTRHQWFFNFGGGTTQTTSFGKFNKVYNNGPSSAPITGGNTDVVPGLTALSARQQYQLAQPKGGFHLFAGLSYQYKLGKQWRVASGLQVAYAANSQQTGAYVTSNPAYTNANYIAQIATGTDKNLQEGYFLSGKPGSTYTVVNKAWQLQVPVNVSYVVNPRAKTKVLVNAGLTAAWMFNNRWLIPDNRDTKLYYNSAAINSTVVSWQAGPAVELKNQWKFGVQYQQSFTPLAKSTITPRLYWQNISLYAGIPFNITLKKAKK